LAAVALDNEHSEVHEQTVFFKQIIDKDAETLHPQTAQIIKSEFTLLPALTNLSQYNDEYLSRNKDCASRILSALKVRRSISLDSTVSIEKDAAALIKLPFITMDEANKTLAALRSWNSSEIESFRANAAAKWPQASNFAIAS
jgi:hypothetical protein